MKKTPNDKVYSGCTIDQWIFKILNFIDKWALEPAGFPDYFYEARKIKDKSSRGFIQDGILNKSHKPYVSIEDYFYNVRKRINKFMNTINMSDFLKSIDGLNIRLIDSIIESQSMAYHYIGSLKLVLKNKASIISPFFIQTNVTTSILKNY